MALHQKYNNENILSRAIIAGILNILNNKITYEQIWSNEDIETVKVPWFYNMSGDERFMQDFYTFYGWCLPPRPVDGNFDVIPRGVVTYMGSPIDSARITSRYIQGTYLKQVNGQLQTMRSFLYSIPLNVNFSCELWLDTQITALKIEQAIRELFYKTITFYVYYKGMRVGSTVGFPEDIALEKNINYSFEPENKIKITFDLQVETYQPVFDPTTEVNNNDYMVGIGHRLIDNNVTRNDGIITLVTDYQGETVPKGYPLLLEWEYKDENTIINKVDILWSNTGEDTKNVIERGVPNNEYYIWNIPQTFTTYKNPVIIWPDDPSVSVSIYRPPIISILPTLTNPPLIDVSSFTIIDPGYFLSPTADASFNIVLEMRNTANQVVYSGDASINITLEDNKIQNIAVPFGSIVFPGIVDYKTIDIYVVNSVANYNDPLVQTSSTEAFGVTRQVKIV
jgi:hypothetical protein